MIRVSVVASSGAIRFRPEVQAESIQEAVRATDKAGNTLRPSQVLSMTIDTFAAIAPVITAPADNSRNDKDNVAVSGTAEQNTSVELFEDIVTQVNGLVGPDGAVTVTQAVG